jgi:arginyl-tRNA synthetase
MNNMIVSKLTHSIKKALYELYEITLSDEQIRIEKTNIDFKGDYTFVVFPLLKYTKKSPEQSAQQIGEKLIQITDDVKEYNVIKGFLNIELRDEVWIDFLLKNNADEEYGHRAITENNAPVLVEYSCPNTNKPLHLGHIRNNLIGQAMSNILQAMGQKVIQVNLINDRGIHICKTMLAWQKWANGNTPKKMNMKGDHFVGSLYVLFEQELQKEIAELIAQGSSEDEALQQSKLMKEARELLILWEQNDTVVRALWKMMHDWVMSGFLETYQRMGVAFDKYYYESDTYIFGKEIVMQGLTKGVFYKNDNNAISVNLKDVGLDEKVLLRSDGTSVYITQDLGTAVKRHEEWNPKQMIYVVGNEQNYHFQVLKQTLLKAGYDFADGIIHLSYGMVELPEGKMKSREGKVVDADILMEDMYTTASQIAEESGKAMFLPEEQKNHVLETIAQGALKYFILKVDAKKNMVFNPAESIDFNGNTGPFIQYTHARINSLLGKVIESNNSITNLSEVKLHPQEKKVIQILYNYPAVIEESAAELNPSVVCQFVYELAKEYNTFYQTLPVIKAESETSQRLRIMISRMTSQVITSSCKLLGIDMPGIM